MQPPFKVVAQSNLFLGWSRIETLCPITACKGASATNVVGVEEGSKGFLSPSETGKQNQEDPLFNIC